MLATDDAFSPFIMCNRPIRIWASRSNAFSQETLANENCCAYLFQACAVNTQTSSK